MTRRLAISDRLYRPPKQNARTSTAFDNLTHDCHRCHRPAADDELVLTPSPHPGVLYFVHRRPCTTSTTEAP